MLKLTLLLCICCFLAHIDSVKTFSVLSKNNSKTNVNFHIIFITVLLSSVLGLRTGYNDTGAYINGFLNAPDIYDLLAKPENFDLLKNPLFELYTSLVRTFTDNYHIYFMISGIFVSWSMVSFIHKVTDNSSFALTLFTYFTLGTYLFSLAAMKQTIAMAILTYAILALLDKKYIRFVLIVGLAGLFHTYAFALFILPLLMANPWCLRTYVIVGITIATMLTFQNSITALLEYADSIGKGVSEEMVFSGAGMNLMRVAVYSIIPIVSLLCKHILTPQMDTKQKLFIHMSIISFMFMLLASINGANMFGRMARYFEIGAICSFPWVIRHLFTYESQRVVRCVFICSFFAFFAYGFWDFDSVYSSISLNQFILSLVPA